MHISFSPQRRDDVLTVEKSNGDRLRINGELFNFDQLIDGVAIPAGDIPCEWIAGPVERIDGEIHLTLILPHGPNPSQAVAFPEPITITEDGLVEFVTTAMLEMMEARATALEDNSDEEPPPKWNPESLNMESIDVEP